MDHYGDVWTSWKYRGKVIVETFPRRAIIGGIKLTTSMILNTPLLKEIYSTTKFVSTIIPLYVTQDEKRWLSHYFEKNEIFTSLDSPFSWLSAGVFAFSIRRCNREISSETLTCLVTHNSPKNAI